MSCDMRTWEAWWEDHNCTVNTEDWNKTMMVVGERRVAERIDGHNSGLMGWLSHPHWPNNAPKQQKNMSGYSLYVKQMRWSPSDKICYIWSLTMQSVREVHIITPSLLVTENVNRWNKRGMLQIDAHTLQQMDVSNSFTQKWQGYCIHQVQLITHSFLTLRQCKTRAMDNNYNFEGASKLISLSLL